MQTIEWQDFERIELRAGTVLSASNNAKARKPAFALETGLGPLGIKTSGAQITALYRSAKLIGRQVLFLCNFAPKSIAGVRSQVLVSGVDDAERRVVLVSFEQPLVNGRRLA